MGAGHDGLAARGLQDDEYCAMIVPTLCVGMQLRTLCVPRRRASQETLPRGAWERSTLNQSSRALTDFGDNRRLRKLRFTLLRWLTRLGPRAMATPIASTSMTTRWAIREVSGV